VPAPNVADPAVALLPRRQAATLHAPRRADAARPGVDVELGGGEAAEDRQYRGSRGVRSPGRGGDGAAAIGRFAADAWQRRGRSAIWALPRYVRPSEVDLQPYSGLAAHATRLSRELGRVSPQFWSQRRGSCACERVEPMQLLPDAAEERAALAAAWTSLASRLPASSRSSAPCAAPRRVLLTWPDPPTTLSSTTTTMSLRSSPTFARGPLRRPRPRPMPSRA